MVATPITRLTRRLYRFAAALALACGLYMLAVWVGSSIPRNDEWQEPTFADYVIGLETNGVHTALVLPLVTPVKDWREDFAPANLAAPQRPYTHISVSWGERDVLLHTPTWWDLSARTVLRILLQGGEGLAHVAYYVRPAVSDDLRPIRLTAGQYAALTASIEKSFGSVRPSRFYPGYGRSDLFYEVSGRYTAVNTCNQWTSDRLAAAGIRTGRWTPLASGVTKWVQPPALPVALGAAHAPRP